MFVLGIQGSPRKNGNTRDLLSLFMEEIEKAGASTRTLAVRELDIQPCRELIVCEKKGFCPIKDDMETLVYPLLKQADIILLASPVFFYNVPAQLKALIDRCQMFWGRKYRLGLKEPNARFRRGFLLSCGGSGGKKLFDGLELTAKIFFDALSVAYKGGLFYRHIESPGQMAAHPDVKKEIREAVRELFPPIGKRILFVSRQDAGLSQMAAAWFRAHGPEEYQVFSAGSEPAPDLFPETVAVMGEKQLDLKYLKPNSLNELPSDLEFDQVVYLDNTIKTHQISARHTVTWNIGDDGNRSTDQIRQMRDDIQRQVQSLIRSLPSP